MIRAAILIASMLFVANALAQSGEPQPAPVPKIPFDKLASDSRNHVAREGEEAELLYEHRKAARELSLDHARWNQNFVHQSWEWHLLSTKILMGVVLSILAFGLVLTYMQLSHRAIYRRRADPTPVKLIPLNTDGASGDSTTSMDTAPAPIDATNEDNREETTLKISLEGLEITSQIAGVIILGLSLAFFYLYAKDVYPVQQHDLQQSGRKPPAKKGGFQTITVPEVVEADKQESRSDQSGEQK